MALAQGRSTLWVVVPQFLWQLQTALYSKCLRQLNLVLQVLHVNGLVEVVNGLHVVGVFGRVDGDGRSEGLVSPERLWVQCQLVIVIQQIGPDLQNTSSDNYMTGMHCIRDNYLTLYG